MRSKLRPAFVAAALAASIGSAAAIPATVSSSTPLHARPGSRSAVVAMIPAGATIDARACRSWCRVSYGGMMGFVPSPYVTALGASPGYYGSAGYGAGPLDILTAPVGAVGGLFGAGSPTYGYGGDPSYGYGEAPPVVAGY